MSYLKRMSIILSTLIIIGNTGCVPATPPQLNPQENFIIKNNENTLIKNDENAQSVNKMMEDLNSLQMQVELLEKAIAPSTPREAVTKWAEGFKTRNGALQFAVFSPELRDKLRPQWVWITGQSSPWVESYQIADEKQKSADAFEYIVKFNMATSESKNIYSAKVYVKHFGEKWFITEFEPT
ncbi:hypothetical protein [Paradesulfitobacterium ferrireducens]|uniref:hypothetical protein n=1 Tax=Paradesulfitobacterium ferrireducens TaxID=2816476 RepID=UPI001A8F5BF8|nr:hypothetical protein [Paradesulfitobacterium ferrireducens]